MARLRADADSGVDRVMLGQGNHMDLETVRIIGSEVALQVRATALLARAVLAAVAAV